MCAGRRLRWRACCPRCSLTPGRIACTLAGAIIHRRDGAWLGPHYFSDRTPFTATATTAAADAWALPVHRGSFSCLRSSFGDVTMVFVFAGMSHSSYKSKKFMRGEPNPIALCPTALSTSQAMRATCKCTCVDDYVAAVAVVFHGGNRCGVQAMVRWQGWGQQGLAGNPDVHFTDGGHW